MSRPGFGLSLTLLTVLVGGALLLLAAPNYAELRKRSPNDWVVDELREIANAENLFRENDADRNGVFDYGSLAALVSASLVGHALGSGTKHGYTFEVQPGANPQFVWWAVARPVTVDADHNMVFFSNQRGAVFRITVDHPSAREKPDPERGQIPLGAVKIPLPERVVLGRQ